MSKCARFFVIICLALLTAGAETSATATPGAEASTAEQAQTTLKKTQLSISANRKRLRQRLERLKRDLAVEKAARQLDETQLQNLLLKRDNRQKPLGDGSGDYEQITNLTRQYAKNFLALKEKSPHVAETPAEIQAMKQFGTREDPVGLEDIKRAVVISLRDMDASHEIKRYRGPVLNRQGQTVAAEIIRLGHMGALYKLEGKFGYLTPSPASGQLVTAASPGYRIGRNLKAYFENSASGLFMDITKGVAVTQLARRIPLREQLQSGGLLVWPILLVGLVALGLSLERIWFWVRVRHNTDGLMVQVVRSITAGDFQGALAATQPHQLRPAARVLAAGLENRDNPKEVIESALSEAIVRETPRLERFLVALKVLAAVAPLLGLLGTVTGMINTFQVITTHGTGDPRLMAGGISEAMVTTQMGLAVAIPIMMVAAFLGRRANRLIQDMEEKALSLLGALLKARHLRDPNSDC